MKKRAYVLIFFFWAFLTMITPALVRWSAAAMATSTSLQLLQDGSRTDGEGSREETGKQKMTELAREIQLVTVGLQPPPALLAEPPAPSPVDDKVEEEKSLEEPADDQVVTERHLNYKKLPLMKSRRFLQR